MGRTEVGEMDVPRNPKGALKILPRRSQPAAQAGAAGPGRKSERARRSTEGGAGANRHHWQNASMVIGLRDYKIATGFI